MYGGTVSKIDSMQKNRVKLLPSPKKKAYNSIIQRAGVECLGPIKSG
jgi:hypothetical protein